MRISQESELANRGRIMTYVSFVCDQQICEQCPGVHKDRNETSGVQAFSGMRRTTHHNPSNRIISILCAYIYGGSAVYVRQQTWLEIYGQEGETSDFVPRIIGRCTTGNMPKTNKDIGVRLRNNC
jgi:hypothetical protein